MGHVENLGSPSGLDDYSQFHNNNNNEEISTALLTSSCTDNFNDAIGTSYSNVTRTFFVILSIVIGIVALILIFYSGLMIQLVYYYPYSYATVLLIIYLPLMYVITRVATAFGRMAYTGHGTFVSYMGYHSEDSIGSFVLTQLIYTIAFPVLVNIFMILVFSIVYCLLLLLEWWSSKP